MLTVNTPTPQNWDSKNLPTAFGIYSALGLCAEQTDSGSSLRNEMKRGGPCRQAGCCWSSLWKPVPDSRMIRGQYQAGLSPLLLMTGCKIIQTCYYSCILSNTKLSVLLFNFSLVFTALQYLYLCCGTAVEEKCDFINSWSYLLEVKMGNIVLGEIKPQAVLLQA